MRQPLRIITGTAALGAAALAYAALVERNRYILRRLNVQVLAPGSTPLRVLHLSDLHLTPGQHYKQRWVAALAREEPDLVVVTGDNISAVDAVPAALRALGPLLAYPGAFVFGSNDYRGPVFKNPFGYFRSNLAYTQGVALPTGELRDALTGGGWVDLTNARATIKVGRQVIDLVGVDDPHIHQDSYPLRDPQTDADLGAVRLGLLHSPEPRVLDTMAEDGCDLMFAGHTHGGQVRVPGVGALVTNCGLDRSMARGLHRWPDSTAYLHVSGGLGTHPTAPIRFACRPEATVLTLRPR